MSRYPTFEDFFSEAEPRLRRALVTRFGIDLGREATAEALAVGWAKWRRVRAMDNPVGYVYRVGERWGARQEQRRRRLHRPARVAVDCAQLFEPGLEAALAGLTERQRQVVTLVEGFGYSHSEVAALLCVSRSSVQTHAERGMHALRQTMGVEEPC